MRGIIISLAKPGLLVFPAPPIFPYPRFPLVAREFPLAPVADSSARAADGRRGTHRGFLFVVGAPGGTSAQLTQLS